MTCVLLDSDKVMRTTGLCWGVRVLSFILIVLGFYINCFGGGGEEGDRKGDWNFTGKSVIFLCHSFEFSVKMLLFHSWLSYLSKKILTMYSYITAFPHGFTFQCLLKVNYVTKNY